MTAINVNDPNALTQYLTGQMGLSSAIDPSTGTAVAPPAALMAWVQHETQVAGGSTALLDGFKFSQVQNTATFMQLLTFADQFSASTGWKYYPSATQLRDWSNAPSPSGGWDQQTANNLFFNQMPQQQQTQFPNAQFGKSITDYNTMLGGYVDQWQAITGNRVADQNLMNQAMRENWGPTQMTQFLMQNQWINQTSPWTKYNMSYAQWQVYKVDNKQAIQNRYGLNMASQDAAYIANLANPQQKFAAQDAQSPNTTTTGITQPRGGMQSYASGVR